jgi:hypothetical protein
MKIPFPGLPRPAEILLAVDVQERREIQMTYMKVALKHDFPVPASGGKEKTA